LQFTSSESEQRSLFDHSLSHDLERFPSIARLSNGRQTDIVYPKVAIYFGQKREREREKRPREAIKIVVSRFSNEPSSLHAASLALLTSTALMIDGKVTSIRYFCFR